MQTRIGIVFRESFYMLTAALVLFLAMEVIKPWSVQANFNLSILLIFWLLNGIFWLIINPKE